MRSMKRAILIMLALATVVGLAGCKSKLDDELMEYSKEELVTMYRSLEAERNDLMFEVDDLTLLLRGIQEEEAPTSAISVMGDGTGRLTFNSFKDQIILPSELNYPESSQIASTGSISIVQNITISPSSNWIVKMGNSQIELEHTSGISGIIKIGSISKLYDKTKLQEDVLSPFVQQLPPDTVVYNNIFIGDNMWGVQAQTGTYIDSEDANLTFGVLGYSQQSMVYMFCYRGDKDSVKDEAIETLMNSMTFLGSPVRVGQ